MIRLLALSAALAAALTLTACSAQLGDRGGEEGSPVDKVSDVPYVEVFRNADNMPNIARVCVEGLGFAATSSGLRGDGTTIASPALIRITEWDTFCATKQVQR